MKLRQLEVLHAILQTGSITQAARLLHVSQPSVSTILQHCEAQLGVALFVRAGGRLKPTPEVERLFPDIRAVFLGVEHVTRRAKALASGRSGELAVAGTLALATGHLVNAIAHIRSASPEVCVTLQALQTPELIARVAAREFDVGVCYGPVAHDGVEVEQVTTGELMCVLPEAHPLASKKTISPADLAHESLVTYDPQDNLRGKVDRLFSGSGHVPNIGVQVGQTLTAIRLVQCGAGIGIVEPFYFAAMRPAGLVARPLRPKQQLVVVAVTPYGQVRSRATEDFLVELRKLTKR
ncbi:LysR family transcriptional regulator [Ottowia thiooxydans]|uniref:LysR family transcriptional regulator n=1 Tax=Ottowia thiooxydans TaxID=219182 RepID=UPI0004107EC2|nr:LysR family transcriptional regulator [Ottowia thiooxydans]